MGHFESLLSAIFSSKLERGSAPLRAIAEKLGEPRKTCRLMLEQAELEGLTTRTARGYGLTPKGRSRLRIVLVGGTFDIIHVGHLATLSEARKLGNFLLVVVARDETVEKLKGHKPLNDELTRLSVVRQLKPVDAAILGSRRDMFAVVRRAKPEVIALGYDQRHSEEELRRKIDELGLRTDVVRLKVKIPKVKTSEIVSRVTRRIP